MDKKSDHFNYVLVGYKPDQDEQLPQNSVVLFDGPASVNFEHLLAGGLLISNESQSMVPYLDDPGAEWFGSSRVNTQMATNTDITDPHARSLLGRYYMAIEIGDYETIADCVTDDVIYRMHPMVDDPDTPYAESIGMTKRFLLQNIKRWREKFGPFRYDVLWSIVGTSNAMTRFRLTAGSIVQETQCAYTFQVTNLFKREPIYKISSITHIIAADQDPAVSVLTQS